MWPFRRKQPIRGPSWASPPCPFCGSARTGLNYGPDGSLTGHIKVWRGQRQLICRCLDCRQVFYADEPVGGVPQEIIENDCTIDEEALQSAEEELKRQEKEEREQRRW